MRFDKNDEEKDEAQWSMKFSKDDTETNEDTLTQNDVIMALEGNTQIIDANATTVGTPEDDWEKRMKLLEVRNPEDAAEFITALKNMYQGFNYRNIEY